MTVPAVAILHINGTGGSPRRYLDSQFIRLLGIRKNARRTIGDTSISRPYHSLILSQSNTVTGLALPRPATTPIAYRFWEFALLRATLRWHYLPLLTPLRDAGLFSLLFYPTPAATLPPAPTPGLPGWRTPALYCSSGLWRASDSGKRVNPSPTQRFPTTGLHVC